MSKGKKYKIPHKYLRKYQHGVKKYLVLGLVLIKFIKTKENEK